MAPCVWRPTNVLKWQLFGGYFSAILRQQFHSSQGQRKVLLPLFKIIFLTLGVAVIETSEKALAAGHRLHPADIQTFTASASPGHV